MCCSRRFKQIEGTTKDGEDTTSVSHYYHSSLSLTCGYSLCSFSDITGIFSLLIHNPFQENFSDGLKVPNRKRSNWFRVTSWKPATLPALSNFHPSLHQMIPFPRRLFPYYKDLGSLSQGHMETGNADSLSVGAEREAGTTAGTFPLSHLPS